MGTTKRVAVGLVGLLLVGACGQTGPTDGSAADGQPRATVSIAGGATGPSAQAGSDPGADSSETVAPSSQPSIVVNLPAVEVIDVATGATFSLASVIAADRPTLLWMWAPY